MQIFDTHAHYFDEKFDTDYPGGMKAALQDSVSAGVSCIVNVGTTPETSLSAIQLAEEYPFCYATVGLHPTDSEQFTDSSLPEIWNFLRSSSAHPKVVAIGEIGLDYHWEPFQKERQKNIFHTQLELAESVHLPVIVHDRDAHGDCFDIVRQHPHSVGVFHSFSGSAEMARQLVNLGWYISFSGTLTYKSARHVREAAAIVPPDRILVETDAPYLPPVPHRGCTNVSAYLVHTLQALADVFQTDASSMAEITMRNAKQFYHIS